MKKETRWGQKGKEEKGYNAVLARADAGDEERKDVVDADVDVINELRPLGVDAKNALFRDEEVVGELHWTKGLSILTGKV